MPVLVGDLALLGVDDDDVAGLHLATSAFSGSAPESSSGVEEDRGDDAADDDAGGLLVRNAGDLLADVPEDAVAGRFARGAGADDVADEGDLVPFLPELGDGVEPFLEAGLAHGQGVQRDIRAAPGVAGRGEVVGVDLAFDLEHLDLDGLGHAGREVNHSASAQDFKTLAAAAFLALASAATSSKPSYTRVMCGERLGGLVGQFSVLESGNQRSDVVAAEHGAEHANRVNLGDER